MVVVGDGSYTYIVGHHDVVQFEIPEIDNKLDQSAHGQTAIRDSPIDDAQTMQILNGHHDFGTIKAHFCLVKAFLFVQVKLEITAATEFHDKANVVLFGMEVKGKFDIRSLLPKG